MTLSALKSFSAIVEEIYNCAFDLELWPNTLEMIADYTGSYFIALDFMDMAHHELNRMFSHRFNDAFRGALLEKYAHAWMLQSGFHLWDVGRPMHLPEILPEAEFYAGVFYREWCKPQRNGDYVGMIAFRDSTRFVKMTNSRLDDQEAYDQDAMERFKLLSPHICKSVAVSDAFRLQRVRTGMFEAMIDNLPTGVILLEPSGRVDYMNPAAAAMIAVSPLLAYDGGMLHPSGTQTGTLWRDALRAATEKNADDTFSAEVIAISDNSQAGFIATMLPMANASQRELLQSNKASVAVFLRDPVMRPVFAVEAFAGFYKLSPAEARVAAVLSQGGGLPGVCDVLGIAHTTAKTHLQRIFEKTGTSRQSELAAMMMASSI
jgi:DNA-binding CsgD family transcriptional regulator/PAS domain-containing protein